MLREQLDITGATNTALSDIITCILMIMLLVISVMVMPQQQGQDATPTSVEESTDAPEAPEPPKPAPPAPAPPKPRIGFSLRFANDEALGKLTAAGTVRLYSVTGGRAHKWKYGSEWALALEEDMPRQYYRLERVPTVLQETAARIGKGIPEFGVILDQSIMTQLRRIMKEHTGGDLIINSDATVQLSS